MSEYTSYIFLKKNIPQGSKKKTVSGPILYLARWKQRQLYFTFRNDLAPKYSIKNRLFLSSGSAQERFSSITILKTGNNHLFLISVSISSISSSTTLGLPCHEREKFTAKYSTANQSKLQLIKESRSQKKKKKRSTEVFNPIIRLNTIMTRRKTHFLKHIFSIYSFLGWQRSWLILR